MLILFSLHILNSHYSAYAGELRGMNAALSVLLQEEGMAV